MKRNLTNIVLSIGFLALGTATLRAQSVTRETATVPFTFHVNGAKQSPAGEYRVEQNISNGLFTFHNRAGSMMILPGVHQERRNAEPKLVFHRCGGEYFLSEIWTEGMTYRLRPSQLEKELMLEGSYTALVTVPLR